MNIDQPYFIKTAEITGRFINVEWSNGLNSSINHFWLRDNCTCSICGNHESGSRFLLWTTLPRTVSPRSISWNEQHLNVIWDDREHCSQYCLNWIYHNCNAKDDAESFGRTKTFWDKNLPSIPTVDFRRAIGDENELFKLFENVSRYGFVLVHNVGTERADTATLAKRIGYTRNTHFGEITDLQLRDEGRHLADFPLAITQHTDETYRLMPTGINIFHCITPSQDGGGISSITDSFSCALKLRQDAPDSFNLLTRTPIRHARRAGNELIESNYPPLLLDSQGRLSEIRLNERTMSSIRVAPDLIDQVYDALRNLFNIAYSGKFTVNYLMQAGDALVFDNLRVLHGRTSFNSERLIRQTNVMRDEFYARHAFLAEKFLHVANNYSLPENAS